MPTITSLFEADNVKIYVNGILHLWFDRNELVGIQSWTEAATKFKIEYFFKTTSIICEYTDKEMWEEILKQIDKGI